MLKLKILLLLFEFHVYYKKEKYTFYLKNIKKILNRKKN